MDITCTCGVTISDMNQVYRRAIFKCTCGKVIDLTKLTLKEKWEMSRKCPSNKEQIGGCRTCDGQARKVKSIFGWCWCYKKEKSNVY